MCFFWGFYVVRDRGAAVHEYGRKFGVSVCLDACVSLVCPFVGGGSGALECPYGFVERDVRRVERYAVVLVVSVNGFVFVQ